MMERAGDKCGDNGGDFTEKRNGEIGYIYKIYMSKFGV